MFVPKGDVFKDLRRETVDEISDIAIEESYDKGAVLFSRGDPANHFYILVNGSVRLRIGQQATIDYVVGNLGEAFGWSSVVDRECYTASAECLAPTKLMKINKDSLQLIFDRHPDSGTVFYKRLAQEIGTRLIDRLDQ